MFLNSIHTFVNSPFITFCSITPSEWAICFLLGPKIIQYQSFRSESHIKSLLLLWFSMFYFYLWRSSKNQSYTTNKFLEGCGTLPTQHPTQNHSSSLPSPNSSLKSKGFGSHSQTSWPNPNPSLTRGERLLANFPKCPLLALVGLIYALGLHQQFASISSKV